MKLAKLVNPFKVEKGRHFRLKQVDPADTCGLSLDRDAGGRSPEGGGRAARRAPGAPLCRAALGAAGHLPGDGCRRQGQRHQACDVRGQSPGLPGLFLPPALGGGSSITTTCGAAWRGCPSAGISASSTAPITRRRWRSGSIASSWQCEHLPPKLVGPKIWQQRFDDINGAERYLAHNGIVICKFFLHVSKAEQRRRFIARLEEPDKQWKFEPADLTARQNWDAYMHAYEETIRQTATPEAPWHVVPADNKWFTRLVVVGGPDPAAEISRPPISATQPPPPPQAEGGPRRPGAGKALSEAR